MAVVSRGKEVAQKRGHDDARKNECAEWSGTIPCFRSQKKQQMWGGECGCRGENEVGETDPALFDSEPDMSAPSASC